MKYITNPDTKCTCSNPRHHAKWILNSAGILRSVKAVLDTGNIDKLTRDAYDFLYNMSGFIAHYDINGFKAHYANVEDLRQNILRSSDIGDNRFISDSYFSQGEQKDYYAAKYDVGNKIGKFAKSLEKKSQEREIGVVQDKINLLEVVVQKAKSDPIFAKDTLQKLGLI